jgi:hypothetical protein
MGKKSKNAGATKAAKPGVAQGGVGGAMSQESLQAQVDLVPSDPLEHAVSHVDEASAANRVRGSNLPCETVAKN